MGKVEKTVQIERQEANFLPTMKLWFEAGICANIRAVAL